MEILHFRTLQTLAHARCSNVLIGAYNKMAATSTSGSCVSLSSVVNYYGTSSQSMSAPSAVTVQVLSSSPATGDISRGGSVDNGTVGHTAIGYIWSNC